MRDTNMQELKMKVNTYCNDHKSVKLSKESISIADLITILKEYYQELHDLNDPKSEAYKDILDEINSIISPEYAAVLKKRRSNVNVGKIRKIIMHGISVIGSPRHKNRCTGIKVCIKREICAILLDIYEQGERKPIILCRDIDAGRVHLAKDSHNNERLLDMIRSKIVNIFDIVDSYRATLPRSEDSSEITEEIINNHNVYDGDYFEVPFLNPLFKGNIRVYGSGDVTLDMEVLVGDEFKDIYKVLDKDTIANILERTSLDIPELKDPIKSIVLASFEKEYNVVNGEYRLV